MKMLLLRFTQFSVFFVAFIQEGAGFSLLEPTNITTPNLIREAKYPFEEHQVTTEDGYILTLHRIPYSPNIAHNKRNEPLPIAFLQHGLLLSSTDWVALGPGNALGYLLSDKGFDVWLGNTRGNRYSMKHVTKNLQSSEFWNFTWHEMGAYDLPAVFNYISNKTEVDAFTYIGHSQGTTQFFVFCSIDPSCQSRIKAAHLLAPGVFTKNFRFVGAGIAAAILGNPNVFFAHFGSFNIGPNTKLFHNLAEFICNDNSPLQFACADLIFLLAGQSNYLNESMIPFLAGAYPAGSSFKQVEHYLQEYNSGKFCQFDYGIARNLEAYKKKTPPEYNLKNISAPLYFYHSENDNFASPKDVSHLVEALPKAVVRDVYKISEGKWNHFDFLFGNHIKTLLYDEVLKNIKDE